MSPGLASLPPSPCPAGTAERHYHAWLLLVAALALHVADEALTGFLDVYNPAVLWMRDRLAWFPAPTFAFVPWLTGLIVGVFALAAIAPAVRRGAPLTRAASWALGVLMLANALGHLAGSAVFARWLPGATSSPLLAGASLGLLIATAARSRAIREGPARPSSNV